MNMPRIQRVWDWFRYEMRMSITGARHREEGDAAIHMQNRDHDCPGCQEEMAWRDRRQGQSIPAMMKEWVVYARRGDERYAPPSSR